MEDSGETLAEIVSDIQNVAATISDLVITNRNQANEIDSVNSTIVDVENLTQQDAVLVAQTASASQSMSQDSDQLSRIMEYFKIRNRSIQ